METKSIRVQVQGWDVNVTEFFKEVKISQTNYKNIETSWDKVKEYRDMIKKNKTEYPYVILEQDPQFSDWYNIIDGAHRIKGLLEAGINTVNAIFVISHNN